MRLAFIKCRWGTEMRGGSNLFYYFSGVGETKRKKAHCRNDFFFGWPFLWRFNCYESTTRSRWRLDGNGREREKREKISSLLSKRHRGECRRGAEEGRRDKISEKISKRKKRRTLLPLMSSSPFFLGERWERDEVQERAESRPAGGKWERHGRETRESLFL